MADSLREILDIARREMPDIPLEAWARMENIIRINFGTQRPYIAAQRKRAHLEALAALDEQKTAEQVASALGVSVRRVRQLRQLK